MDGSAAGRQPAGPNHPTAEAGRLVRARREGGVPFLRADECDPRTRGGGAGDRDGDASGHRWGRGHQPAYPRGSSRSGCERDLPRRRCAGGSRAGLRHGVDPAGRQNRRPGNIYVALAKRFVFGVVDIDRIAGPSDIVVLADEHADPEYVAADLLSQAEHDEMSSAILVTTSRELAECGSAELWRQLDVLPKKAIAAVSTATKELSSSWIAWTKALTWSTAWHRSIGADGAGAV